MKEGISSMLDSEKRGALREPLIQAFQVRMV